MGDLTRTGNKYAGMAFSAGGGLTSTTAIRHVARLRRVRALPLSSSAHEASPGLGGPDLRGCVVMHARR